MGRGCIGHLSQDKTDHKDVFAINIPKFCQIGTYNSTVLQVEEQSLWFNQFLMRYHLEESMGKYISYGNLVFLPGIYGGDFVKDFTA